MPDQMQGPTPLQQFIQQHMEVQQFMEQLRAQGAQEELATRQVENQELESFFNMAQRVRDPQQLEGLVNFYGARTGDATPFKTLAEQAVTSLETQTASAGMRMTPEAWDDVLAIGQGRKINATDAVRLSQAWESLGLDREKFTETIRQFGEEMGLRKLALQLQDMREGQRIGLAAQAEGRMQAQGDRELNLREFDILGQQDAQRRNTLVASDTFIPSMLGEQSNILNELVQKRNQATDPAEQAQLNHQIIETQMSSKLLEEIMRAQFSQGAGAGGMDLNQTYSALTAAWEDVNKSPAGSPAHAEALRRYNLLASQIPGLGAAPPAQPGWFSQFLHNLIRQPALVPPEPR